MQLNNIEEKPSQIQDNISSNVKRSKSASYIKDNTKRIKRREQNWKSINDEKLFVQNFNEILLPSVLKSGESPILERKKQQQELLEKEQQQQQQQQQQQDMIIQSSVNDRIQAEFQQQFPKPPALNISGTPPREQFKKMPFLSPVGENEIEFTPADNDAAAQNNEESIKDENDSSMFEHNLPHCGDFDEPINDQEFSGFDQETVIWKDDLPMGKENIYVKNQDSSETMDDARVSETAEDYSNTLNGLEKIPISKTAWLPKANSQNKSSSIHNISLQDWNENIDAWNDQRNRSGANLNIPGINRLVSDQNLKNFNEKDDKGSLLLPPADPRSDNIDNIMGMRAQQDVLLIRF
ncbi:hypothetical protein QCA50_018182 [Cerrena zonata]|uniref:Uncharacterized protein n=1 Tax=Cerrena zonata TaxID=2478898 RepID=A0AAW0FN86_9APHY